MHNQTPRTMNDIYSPPPCHCVVIAKGVPEKIGQSKLGTFENFGFPLIIYKILDFLSWVGTDKS